MKNKIILQSVEYKLLCQGFTDWLAIQNYATVQQHTKQIEHFLKHQEQNNKLAIEQLTATDPNHFLQTKTTASNNYKNKIVQSLKLFNKYLQVTNRTQLGFVLERLPATRNKPNYFTKQEIQALYEAIQPNVLGIRDEATLALYYGCGLRLNEGKHILISDIDFTKKVLHVKKGKAYKERFVPIAEKSFNALKNYLDVARPQLINENNRNDYLLIGANTGKAMDKQSIYIRIKRLIKIAQIKKPVSTHSLRHSIATHLLQSGMKLEKIKEFLGHSHLDATQIYTHLVNG